MRMLKSGGKIKKQLGKTYLDAVHLLQTVRALTTLYVATSCSKPVRAKRILAPAVWSIVPLKLDTLVRIPEQKSRQVSLQKLSGKRQTYAQDVFLHSFSNQYLHSEILFRDNVFGGWIGLESSLSLWALVHPTVVHCPCIKKRRQISTFDILGREVAAACKVSLQIAVATNSAIYTYSPTNRPRPARFGLRRQT